MQDRIERTEQATGPRRYLATCESLPKIQNMAITSLHLNIGDKQANVAGNLQSTKPSSDVIHR